MRSFRPHAPIGFVLALTLAAAANAQSSYVIERTSSTVTFRGRALVQPIVGRSSSLRGSLQLRNKDVRTARGAVRFSVASLETNPRLENEELLAVFGGASNPDIVFFVDSIGRDRDGIAWRLFGKLTMNGVTRPVEFEGSAQVEPQGRLVARGVTNIDVRDWRIAPPRRLAGLVRMHHAITLSFSAEFRPRGTIQTASFGSVETRRLRGG